MHDLKYDALITGEPKWEVSVTSIRTESLRSIVRTFGTNLMRTASLAFTPVAIAYAARREQRLEDYATLKATGAIDAQLSFLIEDELPDVIRQELKEERDKERFRSDYNELTKDYGLSFVESFLNIAPGMRVSMEALMSSVVIESWTALETLAPRLWKEAVNNGPSEFAQRVAVAIQGKPDAKVQEHYKEKLQFDPRKDWAASQIELGNVSFRKLDRIIYWYSTTLKNGVRRIFGEHKDIHALSAYRNVLIHNEGIVDRDFIKQIEPVSDLRGTFTAKQKIQLDGEVVKRLRNASISLGTALLRFVDDALSPPSPS